MRKAGIAGIACLLLAPIIYYAPLAHAATIKITIDPGNASSYSGSGPSVTDLTSGLTGTMTNVTYSAATNCGVFTFAGNSKIAFGSTDFGNQFSVSAWVYPTSDAYSIQTLMSNAGANLATNGFKVEWNDWNTYNKKMLFENGNSTTGQVTSSNTAQIVVGEWQHLVYTFNKSNNTVTMYRNGSSVATNGLATVSGFSTNQSWWIGSMGGNSYYMNARLGVFKIYSTVLTAAEVTTDYNSTSARYAATPTCPAAAPANSSAPTISGTTTYGNSLTAGVGTWSGSPSYGYQWQRAATSGGTYSDISGATSSSYSLVAADVGQYIKLKVTATNGVGSTVALSSASAAIAKAAGSLSFATTSYLKAYNETVTVLASGIGSGAITYSKGSSTACDVNTSTGLVTVTASSGTCTITALIAADSIYLAASSSNSVAVSVKRALSSASISFAGGELVFRQAKNITVVASTAGKVTFMVSGKRIPGCISKAASAGNSFTVTCAYRPAVRGGVTISATFTPSGDNFDGSVTSSARFSVINRTGNRGA